MDTDGAPDAALFAALDPIAPDPLVPVVSAPLKATTVIDAATLWDNVAVTVTPESIEGANARQISAVPSCRFARCTLTQANPPPVTLLTFIPADFASVDTNANNNSPADVVVTEGDTIVVDEVDLDVVRDT